MCPVSSRSDHDRLSPGLLPDSRMRQSRDCKLRQVNLNFLVYTVSSIRAFGRSELRDTLRGFDPQGESRHEQGTQAIH